MKLFIKQRKRRKGEFQFYMHQFIDAVTEKGIPLKKEYYFSYSYKIRYIIVYCWYFLSVLFGKRKKKNAVIVTSDGENLMAEAFPYFFNAEIIPVLWDVWPYTWESLYKSLRLLKCKVLFVTVKSMAEKLSTDLDIKAYWLPEGIDVKLYSKGNNLSKRHIDIYELGRQFIKYHSVIEKVCYELDKVWIGNKYDENGRLISLAFTSESEFKKGLKDSKILVSFPQVDTHPQRAGGLETLTQRYWEAMLSGCLIVGRSPQELIDIMGYNPVIEIDWSEPENQLKSVLEHISSYQPLVDKNYIAAINKASWNSRMTDLAKELKKLEYTF